MKVSAVFLIAVMLLGSMFPINLAFSSTLPNALDQTSEQKNSFNFTTSTPDADWRAMLSIDSDHDPAVSQRLNISWSGNTTGTTNQLQSGLVYSNPPTTQWNKTYGGTDWDYAGALVRTSDGGYALAGRTDSFGVGNGDFWLVKTDANGNVGGVESGLAWVDSSANTITLYRGATDTSWNYVQVRLWKPR